MDTQFWSQYLNESENLLWEGRPNFQRADRKLHKLLTVLITLFLLIMIILFIPRSDTLLWGIMLFVVGFGGLALLGYFYASQEPNTLRNTRYALTNSRALKVLVETPQSVSLAQTEIEVKDERSIAFVSPEGTILFRELKDPQAVLDMAQTAKQFAS